MRSLLLVALAACSSSSEPHTVKIDKLGLAIDMPGEKLKITDEGTGVAIRDAGKPKAFRAWLNVRVVDAPGAVTPGPDMSEHRVEKIGDGTLVTYRAKTAGGEHLQAHWYRTINGKTIECEYGTDDAAARDRLITACKTLRAATAN